jgi:hypothetical protein
MVPLGHAHVYEPTVLVHTELKGQGKIGAPHSLMSRQPMLPKPGLQAHAKEPTVLTQFMEVLTQLWVPRLHSSASMHAFPASVKPEVQLHEKDPSVLMQT